MKWNQFAGWLEVRSDRTLLGGVIVIFAILAAASAWTKRPLSDEGHFASAAYNLATHGYMGTTVLPEPNSPAFQGINRHTYWIMPVSLLHEAAFFKIFGASLFTMRLAAVCYGALAVAACFFLVLCLTRSRWAALLGALIAGTDYAFVMSASLGRPDMLCAAFGLSGIAAYLYWRELHFPRAVLISQTLIVLSGLCHFNGLLYFAGLLAVTLWLDRRRIEWRHFALGAIPYFAGAAAWGLYILQSPADFTAQFFGNAAMGGRMSFLNDPLGAIGREIRERYLTGFGLGAHNAGSAGPIFLKALVLVVYWCATAAALGMAAVRRLPGVPVLLVLLGIFSVLLTLIDGQKLTLYLVHVIPLYAMLLAVVVCWLATRGRAGVAAGALIVLAVVGLQAGGVLLRVRQDQYHRRFLPAADALAQVSQGQGLVMASSPFAFRLGQEGQVLDDPYLGYFSHRTPDFVIVEELYEIAFADIASKNSDAARHIRELLGRYKIVYSESGAVVYARPVR